MEAEEQTREACCKGLMIGLMLLFKLVIRILVVACYIKNVSDLVTDPVTSTLNTIYYCP